MADTTSNNYLQQQNQGLPPSAIVQQPMPAGQPLQPTQTQFFTSDPNRPAPIAHLIPPPIPGVPIGLEFLLPLNIILIKQSIEVLEAIAGIETANHYNVFAGNGQRIYTAHETTGCCALFCGGAQRPFKIYIHDPFGRSVLYLDRPCDGCLYLTNAFPCFCGQIGGNMFVRLGGEGGPALGEVVHIFDCCKPKYHILDSSGKHIFTIRGPSGADYWSCAICGSADFPLLSPDERQIGMIRKSFGGLAQELFTDADNFGVEFPANLPVTWKALAFAAVFLIDFMYFETDSGHHHY